MLIVNIALWFFYGSYLIINVLFHFPMIVERCFHYGKSISNYEEGI